jgi:hypothetical protein
MSEIVKQVILGLLGACVSYGFAIGVAYGIILGRKSESKYLRWAWIGSIVGFLASIAYIIIGYHI